MFTNQNNKEDDSTLLSPFITTFPPTQRTKSRAVSRGRLASVLRQLQGATGGRRALSAGARGQVAENGTRRKRVTHLVDAGEGRVLGTVMERCLARPVSFVHAGRLQRGEKEGKLLSIKEWPNHSYFG